MEKKIELKYDKNLNIEKLQQKLGLHFPEYKQSVQTWGVNAPFIKLKKSFFVYAIVFVKHQPKKQKTVIGINGGMNPFAIVLFGFIIHYILRGNFLNNVKDALEQELL